MYIGGKFVESKTNDWIDVHNPATNDVNLYSIFYLQYKSAFFIFTMVLFFLIIMSLGCV